MTCRKDTNASTKGLQHSWTKNIHPEDWGGMQQSSAWGMVGVEQAPPPVRAQEQNVINLQASGERQRKVPERYNGSCYPVLPSTTCRTKRQVEMLLTDEKG